MQELLDAAVRSKSIYLVFGTAAVFSVLLAYGWFVARASRGVTAEPKPPAPVPEDPGAQILEGADRAFKAGAYGVALMMYKDYELRYAGSPGYASNAPRVWELMRTSSTMSDEPDPALPGYLDERKRLQEAWLKLPAGDRADFLASLPTLDGRKRLPG